MKKITGVFNCGCCTNLFPNIHKHTHHKVPKAAGGPDTKSNLIDLCPSCHDMLHNLAWKLSSKAHSQAQALDSLNILYPDNSEARKICLDLAIKVRDATIISRERGLQPDHLVNVVTVLRKQHKDLMALRCKEYKVSQEEYIRALILRDLKNKFTQHNIDPANEAQIIKSIRRQKSKN